MKSQHKRERCFLSRIRILECELRRLSLPPIFSHVDIGQCVVVALFSDLKGFSRFGLHCNLISDLLLPAPVA